MINPNFTYRHVLSSYIFCVFFPILKFSRGLFTKQMYYFEELSFPFPMQKQSCKTVYILQSNDKEYTWGYLENIAVSDDSWNIHVNVK